MSDQELVPEQAGQHPYEHAALRAHFAARAEDVQPSPELARRVAAIRPPAGRRWPSPRLSALTLGGLAVAGTAAVVLLTGHPAAGPDRPSPLAPPGTGVPATPQPPATGPATRATDPSPATAPPGTWTSPGHSAPPAPPSGSIPTSAATSSGFPAPGLPGATSAGPDSHPPSTSAPTPVLPSTRVAPPPTMGGH